MCLCKILTIFCKADQPPCTNAITELQDEKKEFEREVNEFLSRATVTIDGEKFLKAKNVLAIFGVNIDQISLEDDMWSELQSLLVGYILKSSKTPMRNIWPVPLYTKAPVNLKEPNIHYAFDETVVGFLKKHYTNPEDIQRISIIETAYKQLKKS